jgi:hypothetical protein
MGEYITEYVSSGRNTKNKYYTSFSDIPELTVEDAVKMLDDLGIRGFSWNDTIDDPPVNPGEIVYYYGPCTRISSTHWIALYNNLGHSGKEWTQELCVWVKENKWRLTTAKELEPIEGVGIKTCIRLLDEMLNNPKKKMEVWV